MKFSGREDIDAPIDHVWRQIIDFGAFERQAMRRGADVQRSDSGPYRVGSGWNVAFTYRGKDRKLRAKIVDLDAPNSVRIDSVSSGIDAVLTIELVPLSPLRTRFATGLELTPKSLSARLLLQSLKLAKSSLTNRFKKRLAGYAEEIETRYVRPGR